MIPVSLTLKGIYSYQEAQHIDFTKLTEAKLFGIFGSVGSGKSTILEAITFALYGESERLNKKENRNYNMMNLKSNELLIDFEFEIGQSADRYRFIVQGKRNQKHFERINTFERKAYQWQNQQWFPLETANAEDILGLSYENFKRTIIIPQGKFQEFLQLSETDRTRMLKELFNLDRFELGDKVARVEKENKEALDRLEGELKGMEEFTEETLEATVQARKAKQKEKSQLDKQYQEQKNRLDQLKGLKELNDKLQEAQKSLEALDKQKQDYEKRQQSLEEYEKCWNYFKEKMDRANALDQEINERNQYLKNLKEQKQAKDQELIRKQGELQKLQKEFSDQRTLENSIADMEAILEVTQFQADLDQKKEQREEAKKALTEAQNQLQANKEERKALNETLQQQRNNQLDQGVLGQIKNWFTQRGHYQANIHSFEAELKKADEAIDELKEKRKAVVNDKGLSQLKNGLEGLSVKDLKADLEAFKSDFDHKIHRIDHEELPHYQGQKYLETHAGNLEEGQPCPVCGSTEHPAKLQEGDSEAHIKALQTRKKTYQAWIETINQALQEIEGLKSDYQSLKQQKDQNQASLEKAQKALEEHQESFQWPAYQEVSESRVDELLQEAQSQGAELTKLEKQVADKDQAIDQQQESVQKHEKTYNNLDQQVNTLAERIKAYQQQLRVLSGNDYQGREKERLEQLLKDWRSKLEQFQSLEEAIQNLQQQTEELKHSLTNKQEELNGKQEEKKKVSESLEHLIAQSDFDNLGQIAKILEQSYDVENEKAAIQAFNNQYAEQQGIVKNLKEQLADKEAFKQEEYDNLTTALGEKEKELEAVNQRLAVLNQQVEETQNKLQKKKQLKEEHDKLQTRSDNIKTLKNLFKGSGFVKYVSSVFLKDLCRAANERFYRLTRQQLRLEVTEDNNFRVRDFLNNGRVRNVKTLSGGQTFQASLSLALALAENIQRLTQSSQNFFFLDEGFGSQDKESLNIVFDTLKSLRQENRIVGVISHVEELKEEIDVALNVVNDEERGSLVKGSWSP